MYVTSHCKNTEWLLFLFWWSMYDILWLWCRHLYVLWWPLSLYCVIVMGVMYYVRSFFVGLWSCLVLCHEADWASFWSNQTYVSLRFQAFPRSCVFPVLSAKEGSRVYRCESALCGTRGHSPRKPSSVPVQCTGHLGPLLCMRGAGHMLIRQCTVRTRS